MISPPPPLLGHIPVTVTRDDSILIQFSLHYCRWSCIVKAVRSETSRSQICLGGYLLVRLQAAPTFDQGRHRDKHPPPPPSPFVCSGSDPILQRSCGMQRGSLSNLYRRLPCSSTSGLPPNLTSAGTTYPSSMSSSPSTLGGGSRKGASSSAVTTPPRLCMYRPTCMAQFFRAVNFGRAANSSQLPLSENGGRFDEEKEVGGMETNQDSLPLLHPLFSDRLPCHLHEHRKAGSIKLWNHGGRMCLTRQSRCTYQTPHKAPAGIPEPIWLQPWALFRS